MARDEMVADLRVDLLVHVRGCGTAMTCEQCNDEATTVFQASYMDRESSEIHVNVCWRCWHKLLDRYEGKVNLWGVLNG